MKHKAFDCVQMKREIQRKQREELDGMSDEDKRRVLMDKIQADAILGPFIQRLIQAPVTSPPR